MTKEKFLVGRRPDYHVCAINPENEERGQIGVAWLNENNTVTIKLNMGVTVPHTWKITMFPPDHKQSTGLPPV